ncbi:MAG: hypothetical protein LUD19_03605 [Clostridia bacterium]|nr:hypothetical protein [Clostridia bacterium]
MFLRKGTCKQGRYVHPTYNGIDYRGRPIQIFRDAPIEKIGHMPEYDAFKAALKRLADNNTEENE